MDKRYIGQFTWLILFLQLAGLFYCGEVSCQHEDSYDACQTVLCSIEDENDVPCSTSPLSHDDACNCICQITYNIRSVTFLQTILSVESFPNVQPSLAVTIPAFGIDHIPRV